MGARKDWALIGVVWALALLAALAIGFFVATPHQLTLVTLAMLALFLVSGGMQLTRPSRGFIARMTLSSAGAFLILSVATLVMALAGGAGTLIPDAR